MAIVSVKLRFEGRGGRFRIDRGREYNEVYIVETDGVDVGTYEILTAIDPADGTRIPQPGERHSDHVDPGDEYALVQQTEPFQVADSATVYEVRVNYSTIVAHTQEAAVPLDRAPKYSWGFLSTTAPYALDVHGMPSENTAGVPYDPPLMRTQSIPELSVRWNTQAYSQALVTSRMNTVNSEPFSVVGYDIPRGQAKLVAWNAEGLSEAGRFFFANSVALQFRQLDPGWPEQGEDGFDAWPWDHVIMQYGTSQLKYHEDIPGGDVVGRENIMIVAGPDTKELIQPQEPQKLDKWGRWLEDKRWTPWTHAWRIHRRYRMVPFGVLGLPT